MDEIEPFAIGVLFVSLAFILAVLSNRVSAWIRIPAPALFLIVAAVVAEFVPGVGGMRKEVAQSLVTIALVFILFDGGMHIGWRKFRSSLGAIAWLGVAGTAVTAAAIAVLAHFLFGFDWQISLLLGAALSPTDPAVVFSVLGSKEISGRTGTILEGESGANDPVGIALMVSLLGASGAAGTGAVWSGIGEFALQMAVGAVVGVIGGWALGKLMRGFYLPNEALYSVRTIACAAFIYAAATLLHGSGFLAVLLAGILVGDLRVPYKREIQRFSAGIASLSEIAAFVILGLSVNLDVVFRPDVLWPGLAIAALLIFLVRPLLVGALALPIRVAAGERWFILWAGLKGAVPILLGMFVLEAKIPGATRLYGIIFIVVLVSVMLQGGLVPVFARLLRVPMRTVEPEPWSSGLRFMHRPRGLNQFTVEPGSPAEGRSVADLNLGENGWISMIRREGKLVQVRPSTRFEADDRVLALRGREVDLAELFDAAPVQATPAPKPPTEKMPTEKTDDTGLAAQ